MVPLQPLVRPATFFDRDRYELGPALLVVAAVALATTLAFAAVGWLLARSVSTGQTLWSRWLGYLPVVFASVVVGWLLTAGALYGLSALFGGDGPFVDTAVVAAWGLLPSLLQTAAGLTALALSLRGVETTSVPVLLERLRAGSTPRGVGTGLATLLTVAWQGYVWTYGIEQARDLSRPAALLTGALVALTALLFALA